jgi:hypothetical protein
MQKREPVPLNKRKISHVTHALDSESSKKIKNEVKMIEINSMKDTPISSYPQRMNQVFKKECIVGRAFGVVVTKSGKFFFAFLEETGVQISYRIEFDFIGTVSYIFTCLHRLEILTILMICR